MPRPPAAKKVHRCRSGGQQTSIVGSYRQKGQRSPVVSSGAERSNRLSRWKRLAKDRRIGCTAAHPPQSTEIDPPRRPTDTVRLPAKRPNSRTKRTTPIRHVHAATTAEKVARRPSAHAVPSAPRTDRRESLKGAHPPIPRASNGREGRQTPACPKGEDATNTDGRPPTLCRILSQPPLCTWIKPPRRSKDVHPTYEHDRTDDETNREKPALPRSRRTSKGANRPKRQ
jgi:hypothetical protein